MKVYFPIFGFIKSGGFRVLTKIANGLAMDGHDVILVAPQGAVRPYYPVGANVVVEIVNRSGCRLNDGWTGTAPPLSSVSTVIALLRYLRANVRSEDRVVATYNQTAFPVFLSFRGRQFYYIQAYEPEFVADHKFGIRKYARMALAWLSYLLPMERIVNSGVYFRYKNIRAKYLSLPGLDFDVYFPRKMSQKKEGRLIVGFIGRNESWKGGGMVVSAVNRLRNEGLNIQLRVAFVPLEGVEHELYEPKSDQELADFYRSLDVMLTPGLIQMGAVHYPVIEAMACNVPVVTTPYFPATSECAYVVQPGSVGDIADALRDIIVNYNLAEEKARHALDVVRPFNWTLVVRNFEDILKRN